MPVRGSTLNTECSTTPRFPPSPRRSRRTAARGKVKSSPAGDGWSGQRRRARETPARRGPGSGSRSAEPPAPAPGRARGWAGRARTKPRRPGRPQTLRRTPRDAGREKREQQPPHSSGGTKGGRAAAASVSPTANSRPRKRRCSPSAPARTATRKSGSGAAGPPFPGQGPPPGPGFFRLARLPPIADAERVEPWAPASRDARRFPW